MDIGNVLQRLSHASNAQVANQILWDSDSSKYIELWKMSNPSSLHVHFTAWVSNHTFQEKHLPSLLRAVENVRRMNCNSDLKKLDMTVSTLLQKTFNLTNLNIFKDALKVFPEQDQELISQFLVMYLKNSKKEAEEIDLVKALADIPIGDRVEAVRMVQSLECKYKEITIRLWRS